MPIIIRLDALLAERKMTARELALRVNITEANLSILKNGHAKPRRFASPPWRRSAANWAASPGICWPLSRSPDPTGTACVPAITMQQGEPRLPLFVADRCGCEPDRATQMAFTSPSRRRSTNTGSTTSTIRKKMPPPSGSNSRPHKVIRAATVMPSPSAA